MGSFSSVEWADVLLPQKPFLEIFIRGTAVYLLLFLVLRVVLRRQAGAVGITDLLVVVLLADASQNAMASDYKSILDGILLVGTIVLWSYVLDYLSFKFPAIQRVVEPGPLPLIRNGQLLVRNMRQELITKDELMSHLREQGVHKVEEVKIACMESNGRISVVRKDGEKPAGGKRARGL